MPRKPGSILVLLGISLGFFVPLHECNKLDGYKFLVYSTQTCPKNKNEWNKRSSALNCTQGTYRNGYMCLPNQNFTELLEFCYPETLKWIEDGSCLYLVKAPSKLFAYNCYNFRYGCPNTSYLITNVFEHPACVSIENGCFLAEPSCKRSTMFVQETTEHTHTENIHTNENGDMALIAIFPATLIPLCVFSMVCINYRKKYSHGKPIAEEQISLLKTPKKEDEDAKILQHLEEMKKEISERFNQQYQDLKLRIDDLKKENKQLKESKMDFRTLKFVVTYFWALIGYKLKQHMRLEKDKKIPIHDFQKLSEEVKELYKKIESIENIVKPAIKENNNKQNCEKINRKNKPEKKNDKLSAVV